MVYYLIQGFVYVVTRMDGTTFSGDYANARTFGGLEFDAALLVSINGFGQDDSKPPREGKYTVHVEC